MPNGEKGSYDVGFGKPPRATQFRPGQSGNSKGRPRGAKNFATAFEDELQITIIVTENGKRKRISKRQVIAKHLVNKAAGGDLKAIPILLNETRDRGSGAGEAEAIFDTAEDQKVFDNFLSRLRQSDRDISGTAPSVRPVEVEADEIPASLEEPK